MNSQGKKGNVKQESSSGSNENGQEDIPDELQPDLRSTKQGFQALVHTMLQNPEQDTHSSSEVRSPASRQATSILNTHSPSNLTPRRTAAEQSIPNFSLSNLTPRRTAAEQSIPNFSRPLARTPTTPAIHTSRTVEAFTDQNSRKLNTTNALSTPTKVRVTAGKGKMDNKNNNDNDGFSEGQLDTAISSTPANRVLDFTDDNTEEPVSRSEQKKKMDVYIPVKMIFTRELWPSIDTNIEELHLDLFWPNVQVEPRDGDVFPLEDLEPLCNFRQLRSLKITGMMESYQKYIWQAVWLNPHLKELTMEMALEPSIRKDHNKAWPTIKGLWRLQKLDNIKTSYHGDKGEGVLRHNLGYGEYLDTFAIMNAKKEAQTKGPITEKLPIATLRLTGFVVDADPFKRWFDPEKLRDIDFTNDCIDAGFGLPVEMLRKVKITYPGGEAPKVLQAQAFKLSDVKLITLKKGKKVAEEPAFPQFSEAAKSKKKGKGKASGGAQVGESSKGGGSDKGGPSKKGGDSSKKGESSRGSEA